MAVDTRSAWIQKAEAAVATLRGVESVRILADEADDIREVHVLSTSNRPAKQIVRDVQSVLVTRFGREIDYRVVSVAYCEPGKVARTAAPAVAPAPLAPAPAPLAPTPLAPAPLAPAPLAPAPLAPAAPPAATLAPAPPARPSVPAPVATSTPFAGDAPASARRGSESAGRDDRIRFVSVNRFVSGARVQTQVELRWKGLPRMGSASGWSTRDGAERLIAAATVAAVLEFLADPVALAVQEVEVVRLGRRDAVVVAVAMLTHRDEKVLSGSCLVGHDLQQAVVLATLSALNRLVGGLRVKEPTEYVVRPTST